MNKVFVKPSANQMSQRDSLSFHSFYFIQKLFFPCSFPCFYNAVHTPPSFLKLFSSVYLSVCILRMLHTDLSLAHETHNYFHCKILLYILTQTYVFFLCSYILLYTKSTFFLYSSPGRDIFCWCLFVCSGLQVLGMILYVFEYSPPYCVML